MYTVRNPIACQGKSSTGNCVRASDTRADHSLRFKDVCKRDLSLVEMNTNTSGVIAPDRDAWRHGVKKGALRAETKVRAEATIKRAARKKRQGLVSREATSYICTICNKVCHSRIGLLSHSKACRHWCADHWLSETRFARHCGKMYSRHPFFLW